MFYHLTHFSRVPSILEKGLDPLHKSDLTLSLNSTLETQLGNSPIIHARNNGIFLYSKKPNVSGKQDYRILEVNVDSTCSIYCADSQHIDPIMKGVIHLKAGGTYDETRRDIFLSDEEMYSQALKYARSWSVWSPTAEAKLSISEIIYVGKILPSQIKGLL
ncbi:hypothetical protein [Priestia megaterium]